MGVGLFGGSSSQAYNIELVENHHGCRGRCLQDPRCDYIAYRPDGDINKCYLYGADFNALAIERDETSLIYHKKCPYGELFSLTYNTFTHLSICVVTFS